MEIIELIKKENIKAKKKFGQNFLIDNNVLNNIVTKSEIENQNVIEIGPGLGSLTNHLIKSAKKVICYEIDKDMVDILEERYKENEKIKIIFNDFLKIDLKKDIYEHFNNEDVIVVANLPYYITTAILTKILEETNQIRKIVVMVQKEVAMRLSGKPSTKDYNSLSVLIQYYTNVKTLFNVSPKSFIPAPEVDSSVILIERKETLQHLESEEYFLKFNRVIFTQRRKTLSNNLKTGFKYSQELIEEILSKNNLQPTVRSESLTVEQIAKLANDFYLSTNK